MDANRVDTRTFWRMVKDLELEHHALLWACKQALEVLQKTPNENVFVIGELQHAIKKAEGGN